MKIIAIAGGSGSGKSSVSYALEDSTPDKISVLNLDDYHKLETDDNLPTLGNMINWDHPDIVDWNKLARYIKQLRGGQPITINTWAHRSNPDYARTGVRIPRTIQPKDILIVEGYLALYNPEINRLYDQKYYFDLDEATRSARRNKSQIIKNPVYETKVLKPMHQKYIEPTKQNADQIVDVRTKSTQHIKNLLLESIAAYS